MFDSWFPPASVARQLHNFCNNANCAVRRSAWLNQRYDEVLTGLEDLAWAKQAQQQGGEIAYVAEAGLVHIHEETWPRVRNRYRREAMALRQIEPCIRFGFADFLVLTVSNIWRYFDAARLQRVLGREWRSIVLFRFNQFFGTWQGHRCLGEINSALRTRLYHPASDATPTGYRIDKHDRDSAVIEYEH